MFVVGRRAKIVLALLPSAVHLDSADQRGNLFARADDFSP